MHVIIKRPRYKDMHVDERQEHGARIGLDLDWILLTKHECTRMRVSTLKSGFIYPGLSLLEYSTETLS
jgi:hypothetical protein